MASPRKELVALLRQRVRAVEYFAPVFDPTVTVATVLLDDGTVLLSSSRPEVGHLFDAEFGRERALLTALDGYAGRMIAQKASVPIDARVVELRPYDVDSPIRVQDLTAVETAKTVLRPTGESDATG
jgi:hypothetical protein